ncbi:hypothetical protein MZM54_04050 [[Brevibacterium] frigoritolerans]|nr:hypothetical protein [Peribacillus frigoritolerans]
MDSYLSDYVFRSKLMDNIPQKLLTMSNIFAIKLPRTGELYILKNRFEEEVKEGELFLYNELSQYFINKNELISQGILFDPNLLYRPGRELLGLNV